VRPEGGAAAVIIGNEVLSAKVRDANGPVLIQRLRDQGIPLRSVEIIPDEVDIIAEAVNRARQRARWVFTSGGIGPTHDDVTVQSVARALGRPVIRLPEMVALLSQNHPEGASEAALRLANAPEGAHLIAAEGMWFPALAVDELYMLPGVPALFRVQLDAVLATLPSFRIFLRTLYVTLRETEFAERLDAVDAAFPEVAIGSYPAFDRALDYRVKITFEGAEDAPVLAALRRFADQLPPDTIVREE
jgi:molybdenum cofactor synthesis domain-containing protein